MPTAGLIPRWRGRRREQRQGRDELRLLTLVYVHGLRS